MKTNGDFILYYLLLLIVQLVVSNYLGITPLMHVSLLPAMVLCIPLSVGTIWAMLIAFVTGLAVDLFGDGLIGLNAFALVPVALFRKPLVSLVFGKDMVERAGSFSIHKNGFPPCLFLTSACSAIFLFLYIFADGAGERPFWYNLVRFLISIFVTIIFGLLVLNIFNPKERR